MATSNEKIQLLINAKDNTGGVLKRIKGQILGIVGAYAGMRVGQEAFKKIIGSAVDFDKTMVSLRAVVKATGRDMSEVLEEMANHTGTLASKAQIAEGFLKGMTTTLTVEQMSKMTMAIKEASLAMGEDFGRQLPLIIKAIKQLNPAILDNIGVTIRLDRLNKRIKDGYFGMGREINEVTQQHAIFIEIMKQTSQFRGQEAERLKTVAGKWQELQAAIDDAAVAIGLWGIDGGMIQSVLSGFTAMTRAVEGFALAAGGAKTALMDMKFDEQHPEVTRYMEEVTKLQQELSDGSISFNVYSLLLSQITGKYSDAVLHTAALIKKQRELRLGIEALAASTKSALVETDFVQPVIGMDRFLDKLADWEEVTVEQIKHTVNLGKELQVMGKVGEDATDGLVVGAKEALEGFETFGMEVTRIMNESLVGSTFAATNQMINQLQLLTTTSHGFFKQMGVSFVNEFVQRAVRGLVTSGLLRLFGAIFSGGTSEIANGFSGGFTGGGLFGAPAIGGGDSLPFSINNRQSNILQEDSNLTGNSLVKFR